MTNDQHNPEHAQEPREPLNIAALLRAAADGELSDCQCEQLEAYLAENPEAESQIRFEKALRSCCERVMTKPCCPDEIRAKILAKADVGTVAASTVAASDSSDGLSNNDDEAYAKRIEGISSYTRSQSFWSRSPMMGAAAALLILVAGALIWQSASLGTHNAPSSLTFQQASYYNRVSEFVVNEHNRCCDDEIAQAKLIQHDIVQTNEYFSEAFEHQLDVPDPQQSGDQIKYFGGGDCAVPSTARSGHLRFDTIAPGGKRVSLSLFIAPDPGLLPLSEGMTYTINAKACQDAGTRLFAWVSNGVQYLLVSDASDEMCAQVRDLMNAPSSLSSI